MISSYSLDQDVSSEAEDSESKSNSSAFSPWQSTSDHRSIEKVANDTIVQDETPEEEDDINVDEDEDDIADHDDNDTNLIRLFTKEYLPTTDYVLDDMTPYQLVVRVATDSITAKPYIASHRNVYFNERNMDGLFLNYMVRGQKAIYCVHI